MRWWRSTEGLNTCLHNLEPQIGGSFPLALKDVEPKLEYRSDVDSLVEDFFIPCLSQSVRYDRAVGYFTSGGLDVAARGLTALIRNGGRMRLVASPFLTESDIRDIELGYRMRGQVVADALSRELDSISDETILKRVQNLAWLVSASLLEIKIAFRTTPDGTPKRGIFHEKVGIFYDQEGGIVAFSGSPNETSSGLVENFEDINVFASWREPRRVEGKVEHFEALWKDSVLGLTVLDFPDASRERLLRYKPDAPVEETSSRAPPHVLKLRPYQARAIRAWEDAGRVGILAMATGTGKTLVALEAIRPLVQAGVTPVIIVPSDLLISQWDQAVSSRYSRARTILCHGGYDNWLEDLESTLQTRNVRNPVRPRFVLATMATACREEFQMAMLNLGQPDSFVSVIDEVHRVGAPTYRNILRLRCAYRLGLSATPSRQWDTEGTKAIMDYFRAVVFDYGLRQAIKDGYLAPYEYRIFPVAMSMDELDDYIGLSKSIAALVSEVVKEHPELKALSLPALLGRLEFDEGEGTLERLTGLLISRRRILKRAAQKEDIILTLAEELRGRSCLIYCEDYEQLDRTRDRLLSAKFHPAEYTARLDPDSRAAILDALRHRHIDIVLSCKCLDEGVDIPSCEAAILMANSRSTREFIQRRGRLLRPHVGKEKSLIFDLLVVPTDRLDRPIYLEEVLEGILISESQRALVFAEDALNRDNAISDLRKIANLFNIDIDKTSMESPPIGSGA